MDASNNDTPTISQNSQTTTNSKLKLTIKTPKDKKDISIDASSTVKEFKDQVANEFNSSVDQICLIYSGKILKDDEDLKKHDIKDGVTIHLVIRAPKSDTNSNTAASSTPPRVQPEKKEPLDEQLQKLTNSIQTLKDEIETDKQSLEPINFELSACITTISQNKDDLARTDIRYRQLNDNRQLLRNQIELEQKQKDLIELEEKTHGLKLDSLIREEKQLRSTQEILLKEKHTASARLATLDQQLIELGQELEQKHLKNAHERYLKHFVRQTVEEIASQGLESFYKVLDQTMMTYHTQKMKQLNKITQVPIGSDIGSVDLGIRDLWRTTYCGSDIDAIEIRSDADEENVSKARRTYNYRVVMLKSGSVMDMRNCCSTGQKVLASPIIRLAFAEPFCLDCCILALDEPTTNLDFENIDGLAQALIE
ncbi:unnamed protein product [Rotaria magnacalcarata]|uniref:Ubiquitin-like domain-containing protein n=1 Tax=Rotaria magnacalcarata TaxID=392030 RepID=A0A816WZL7_9BILA|nr:unnamed protein product [Rotaria magnacalcarata]